MRDSVRGGIEQQPSSAMVGPLTFAAIGTYGEASLWIMTPEKLPYTTLEVMALLILCGRILGQGIKKEVS